MPTIDSKYLIPLCFLTVYIVWGSTYMFIAYAVEEIPPFLTSSIRYFAAGLLLFGLIFLLKQEVKPTTRQIKNAIFAGALLIGVGSSGLAWTLQRMDSGFTALLVATQPLITVNMMWLMNKKRPTNQAFFGVFLGLIGAYLLVSQNNIITSSDQWIAIFVIIIILFTWAYATIFISKADMPKSSFTNTAYQLIAGGSVALLLSLFLENPNDVAWQSLKPITVWSISILIIWGALIVFVAFNYLIQMVSPDKVATTTYVNPVIALLLGWWFRDEIVTTQSIVAAAIMLTGVIFINFEWNTIRKWFGRRSV